MNELAGFDSVVAQLTALADAFGCSFALHLGRMGVMARSTGSAVKSVQMLQEQHTPMPVTQRVDRTRADV
jgi:hypothetical protein